MRLIPLITSLLILISVIIFVRFGVQILWRWFDRKTRNEAKKFQTWVNELFIFWTPQQTIQAAYAANIGIVVVFLIVLITARSPVFAAAAAFGAYWAPIALYRISKTRRLKRLEAQLPDAIAVMVS